MEMSAHIRDRALERASPVLVAAAKGSGLLEALAWPRATEDWFFASGASALPVVTYAFLNEVDLGPVEERHRALLDRATTVAARIPQPT